MTDLRIVLATSGITDKYLFVTNADDSALEKLRREIILNNEDGLGTDIESILNREGYIFRYISDSETDLWIPDFLELFPPSVTLDLDDTDGIC